VGDHRVNGQRIVNEDEVDAESVRAALHQAFDDAIADRHKLRAELYTVIAGLDTTQQVSVR
jgi:hypothetical protein